MKNLTFTFTFNMPQLFIYHYQDYDTFDISNLFYNETGLDEKNIVDLFSDMYTQYFLIIL